MVLIGETGSGKTSFLNLLFNFDMVCDMGLEKCLDALHNFNDMKIENDQKRAMESKTSDARYYDTLFGDLEVGIIDTPRFGDSRGIEEDKKNVKRIIDTIEGVEYVNCICLVINGRQARATAQLQYVLTEISATLPKTAFKNLIIVMTNCQNVICANFDLNELSTYFGSEVVIKDKHVFYIENPYSTLEKCRNEKKRASRKQLVDILKASFQTTGDTLIKMLLTIKDFKEVHTNCFVELYKVKEEVEKKMLHLNVAQQNREELQKRILKTKEELDAAVSTKTLNSKFTSTLKVKKIVVVETTDHNTICGAKNCNSNCHVPCNLSKTMDKENLKGCGCIDQMNNYICTVCKHSYLDHYHSESVFEVREEETIDVDNARKKKFEDAISAHDFCVKLKTECDAKLRKCEDEMEDLKMKLMLTLEMFEKLGSSPSYEKVLEVQIYALEQRIKAQNSGDDLSVLNSTNEELKSKLKILKNTRMIKWAQEMLCVSPSATKDEIDLAYSVLSKKQDEINPDLEQAYKILLDEIKLKV